MKVYLSNEKFYMDDNGNVFELFPDKNNYLKLPTNSCNRTWTSVVKVMNAPNQCVDYGDSIKENRVLGPKSSNPVTKVPSKGLEEYLSEEDRELYLSLVKKAMRNREIEMLRAQIASLENELKDKEAQA